MPSSSTFLLRSVLLSWAVVASVVAAPPEGCSNPWYCDSGCVKCTGIVDDGTTAVATIDVSTCKGSAISWACCTAADSTPGLCSIDGCGTGSGPDTGTNKCEGVTQFYVAVPTGTSSVTINTHDGKTFGDADMNTAQCGGSGNQGGSCVDAGTGVTAHCLVDVALSTCGTPQPPGSCTPPTGAVDDCTAASTTCAPKYYDLGVCQCKDDYPAASGTVCGLADTANCLAAPECDGNGACETKYASAGTVCLPASGLCDIDDVCTGTSSGCTPLFADANTVCRPAENACDIEDRCTGDSAECPCDVTRELGYTFKCSTTQFVCGPVPSEIPKGNGKSYFFGGCGIGTANEWVELPYPECLTETLHAECPAVDGKSHGLSNYALGTCVAQADGSATWTCDETTGKFDVGDSYTPTAPYTSADVPCGDGGGGGSDPSDPDPTCDGTCTAVCGAGGTWELECPAARRRLGAPPSFLF